MFLNLGSCVDCAMCNIVAGDVYVFPFVSGANDEKT